MAGTLRRFVAFIAGDARTAEGLERLPATPPPEWIRDAAGDERRSEVALELAIKSLELADGAVDSLQSKVSTHLTLLLALVPFALGATAVVIPAPYASLWDWTPLVILLLADVSLAIAIAIASLASGLTESGGISLDRLGILARSLRNEEPTEASLQAAAAEALRRATQSAYLSGSRVAQDLFTARRWTLVAVLLAILGIASLGLTGGLNALIDRLGETPKHRIGSSRVHESAADHLRPQSDITHLIGSG